jgi:hypothetical protein
MVRRTRNLAAGHDKVVDQEGDGESNHTSAMAFTY